MTGLSYRQRGWPTVGGDPLHHLQFVFNGNIDFLGAADVNVDSPYALTRTVGDQDVAGVQICGRVQRLLHAGDDRTAQKVERRPCGEVKKSVGAEPDGVDVTAQFDNARKSTAVVRVQLGECPRASAIRCAKFYNNKIIITLNY